jgi:hypothetical protein
VAGVVVFVVDVDLVQVAHLVLSSDGPEELGDAALFCFEEFGGEHEEGFDEGVWVGVGWGEALC